MKWIQILGFVAATCTTASFVPQVIKTLKTRDTKGISLVMYAVFTFGVFVWLIYGLFINDIPIIVSNSVTVTLACIVLGMKIKNG
ncbi:MAG: SemiSWEET transporter [Spirochaetales bacterium]|nr:SemiSWEET transporter [Spirochaetales bacterium]